MEDINDNSPDKSLGLKSIFIYIDSKQSMY